MPFKKKKKKKKKPSAKYTYLHNEWQYLKYPKENEKTVSQTGKSSSQET